MTLVKFHLSVITITKNHWFLDNGFLSYDPDNGNRLMEKSTV